MTRAYRENKNSVFRIIPINMSANRIIGIMAHNFEVLVPTNRICITMIGK